MAPSKSPKAVLFDIGGVCVSSHNAVVIPDADPWLLGPISFRSHLYIREQEQHPKRLD